MDKVFSGASVLVIDDEAFSVSFVSRLLEGIGIGEIVTASNGAEALELLNDRRDGLDLIVCDVNMPEMDGYEFIRRLRFGAAPDCKDLPVLVLTGEDSEKNVQHARILKIDGFFVKPPNKTVFENTVRRIISDRIRAALDSASKGRAP
jgi:CheY-like chemotaxis protein